MATKTVKNERGSTGTKANHFHDSVNCKEAVCVIILIQYSRLKKFQKKIYRKNGAQDTEKKTEE